MSWLNAYACTRSQRPSFITTRIKTAYHHPLRLRLSSRDHIPLQQGLGFEYFEIIVTSDSCQGPSSTETRIMTHQFQQLTPPCYIRDSIPLQQGLRSLVEHR